MIQFRQPLGGVARLVQLHDGLALRVGQPPLADGELLAIAEHGRGGFTAADADVLVDHGLFTIRRVWEATAYR
jgi:hypothetical protein